MAEVVLFHHAHGLTDGVVAFAEELRAAGHVVHVPDLFDGRTFDTVDEGVGYAREIGFGTIRERGHRAAERLPNGLVYAGFSLGAIPAQSLAQTRPGAEGALIFSSAIPPSEFGPWPPGVPMQIHIMEGDNDEGDVDVAREVADEVAEAELFLYPGDAHLFADRSLPTYDQDAAALLTERVLGFLDTLSR